MHYDTCMYTFKVSNWLVSLAIVTWRTKVQLYDDLEELSIELIFVVIACIVVTANDQ